MASMIERHKIKYLTIENIDNLFKVNLHKNWEKSTPGPVMYGIGGASCSGVKDSVACFVFELNTWANKQKIYTCDVHLFLGVDKENQTSNTLILSYVHV